jgi:hypothetical protein
VTDTSTGPAVLSGTDHDVGTLPDEALAACAACPHLAGGHDATSQRWCAATAVGNRERRCICPPGAVVAPGADVPPERAAQPGRLFNQLR